MSTANVVHLALLLLFAAVVGWLWRDHELDRRASFAAELQAAQLLTPKTAR